MKVRKILAGAMLVFTIVFGSMLATTASAGTTVIYDGSGMFKRTDNGFAWSYYKDGEFNTNTDYNVGPVQHVTVGDKTVKSPDGNNFIAMFGDNLGSVIAGFSFHANAGDELMLNYTTVWSGSVWGGTPSLNIRAEHWSYNEKSDTWSQTTKVLAIESLLDGDRDWTTTSTTLDESGSWTLYADLEGTSRPWNFAWGFAGIGGIYLETFDGKGLAPFTTSAPVPVPGAVWLLGSTLVGLVARRRGQ